MSATVMQGQPVLQILLFYMYGAARLALCAPAEIISSLNPAPDYCSSSDHMPPAPPLAAVGACVQRPLTGYMQQPMPAG